MSTFYAIDSAQVSHREYWWGTRSPAVLLGWLLKWLRIRIPSSTDDPNVDSTLPFVVEALPPEVALRFQTPAQELAALGFVEPVYQIIRDAGSSTTIYWATFRHHSGQHFARIHQRIWHQARRADRGTFLSLFTAFTDGTFVVSSSGKPDLAAPPTVHVQRLRGATASALWEAHLLLVAEQANKMVQATRTREELLAIAEQHHVLLRDFPLARGVFRQRTVTEQGQADAFAATVAQAGAAGLEHADVLAELERLQLRKPGWSNALIILVVSVAAFVVAGTARQNWEFTLWLGAAMKIFGYRNLRMFFIPLFGAAVTGQNWNVPGWKKALVSLAGPVPGIALGVGLAVAGLFSGRAWLNQAALLLLLINGFNLLPVLPLDGGHVLHATLFCRNRWLDISFRLVAIGGLLLLALAGIGKIFLYIAMALAIGLPIAFKMGKVTDALRAAALPPPMPGQDRIPLATAQAIIGAVKAEMPAKTNNKTLALQALNVFETLNAHPPGVLATLGLLIVQGGSILLVAVCGFLLVLDKHGGGLRHFASAVIRQPQHEVACGSFVRWSGDAAGVMVRRNTIVTTFSRHAEAKRAFDGLTNRLPAAASLSLIGDSLLLTLPANDDAARERWFNELQNLSTNLFVVLTNRSVGFSVMFIAPNDNTATNLELELRDYFQVAGLAELVPPWAPMARNMGFESTRRARRTWRTIAEGVTGTWADAESKALNQQLAAAV
ncbi:MAG: hypothetical protein DME25_17290, partial [Verrucomicrobia bacterium]